MSGLQNRTGWVPIAVRGNGPGMQVRWSWMGGERFTDPFFDTTIQAVQDRPFGGLFTHETSLSELEAWFTESPGLYPSGFIFHMSRCGSTLVSQMLAALDETVVISEALPIDRLACAVRIPEPDRMNWLRWVVSALGQKRSGRETRYFIKFDARCIAMLPFIRRAFPSVPWIFLYRHPEEVLVAHLRETAAAFVPGVIGDITVVDAPMEEIHKMSGEEYAARVLGRYCELAVQGLDELGMLVNYTQLPEAVGKALSRHFKTPFSPEDLARMEAVAMRDAKRPRRKFAPDSESKRQDATDSVREAVDRWVWPHYLELERLRTRS